MMRAIFWGFVLAGWISSNALAEAPAPPSETPPTPFTITTTAFLDLGALPVLYTCDGKNISPEFAWSNPPKGTKTFAFVVTDPTAPTGTWYHWAVYNIPASATELTEDVSQFPAGALALKNSWGHKKYEGPCPPKGAAHSYIFTLYALSDTLKPVETPADLEKTMQGHILASVVQTAVYSRWNN